MAESHHDRSHQKQKAQDEDCDMLVAGGRGDVVAMESRARHLQGFPKAFQPSEELQRGRHRAADRQLARPLQSVREVLNVIVND